MRICIFTVTLILIGSTIQAKDTPRRPVATYSIVARDSLTGQLGVEDHPNPVKELRRLVTLQRAYLKLNEGDDWIGKGNIDEALEAYQEATEMVPDAATNGEAAFWVGVTLADTGKSVQAIPYLKRAYQQDPHWAELLPRLPASGLLPDDAAMVARLVEAMKK
jgi:tetratricopeptide (TPR) repeat protein